MASAIKALTREGIQEIVQEAIEAAVRSAAKESMSEAVKIAAKEAAGEAVQAMLMTTTKTVTKEAALAAGKAASDLVIKVAKEAEESLLKNMKNIADDLIKNGLVANGKETAVTIVAKQKSFISGVGETLMKNKKLAAGFVTAAALGGYIGSQSLIKNDFAMKIVDITKKDSTTLTIRVEPSKGPMIKLNVGGAVEIQNSNTSPALTNYTFPITKVYSTATTFDINISSFPNYSSLTIVKPPSGDIKYKTSFETELAGVITDVVEDVIAPVVAPVLDTLADAIGLDATTIKVIVLIFVCLVVFVYIIIPLMRSNSSGPTSYSGEYYPRYQYDPYYRPYLDKSPYVNEEVPQIAYDQSDRRSVEEVDGGIINQGE